MNINKFTQNSLQAVQNCEKIAADNGNQELAQEHLLYALLTQDDSLILKLLEKMSIQSQLFVNRVEQAIGKRTKVQGGKAYVGQDLNNVLIHAEDEAKQMGDEYISVEHLFLAMMKYASREMKELFREFGISREGFLHALSTVRGKQRVTSDNPEATYDTLNKYGQDLVDRARELKLDPVIAFPPIRIFGTIGFICSMLLTDVLGFQANYMQFFSCACFGLLLAVYSFTLPNCPVNKGNEKKSLVDAMGLRAFLLFKRKKMAIFFVFSMLLGVSLQITNGFANPFLSSFDKIPEYANTFGVQHANALISLSQVSETLCILLIPFALKHFGIKRVKLIAMLAWVLRFGLFGLGNPGSGVWMFVLSMIVYGVAFDFFNISGSLFVNKETDLAIRSSAQGLFVIMTNGIGATVGTLSAQMVVNHFVDFGSDAPQVAGWSSAWFVFAGYALVVAVLFALIFRYKHTPEEI